MRRTKADAEQTRMQLMKMAVKVFKDKGYVRTRLDDIAKAAGVTRGAIYHHFGNKAKLFKAIHDENHDMVDRMISDVMNEALAPIEGIKKVLATLLIRVEKDEFFREFQEIMEKTKLIDELQPLQRESRTKNSESFKMLAQAIEEAKEEGLVRSDVDSQLFTFTLMGSFIGILRFWRETEETISLEKNANTIAEYLFSGIMDK
ncbi:MAG: TetR family transcriptional regulator [Ignavibacteriae bacterium]|nr:TetR family transcriptional regulator [Ignavibacteriota bacterium]NOG98388.1 TetR family transcriptional regulator [Ignavibacteriota bacterium]